MIEDLAAREDWLFRALVDKVKRLINHGMQLDVLVEGVEKMRTHWLIESRKRGPGLV